MRSSVGVASAQTVKDIPDNEVSMGSAFAATAVSCHWLGPRAHFGCICTPFGQDISHYLRSLG
jgi:hypothetical protein